MTLIDAKATCKALIESRPRLPPFTGILLTTLGCLLMDKGVVDNTMAEGCAEIMVSLRRLQNQQELTLPCVERAGTLGLVLLFTGARRQVLTLRGSRCLLREMQEEETTG